MVQAIQLTDRASFDEIKQILINSYRYLDGRVSEEGKYIISLNVNGRKLLLQNDWLVIDGKVFSVLGPVDFKLAYEEIPDEEVS